MAGGVILLGLLSFGPAVAEPPPVIGDVGVHFVQKGQTLLDIARLYDLGYIELLAANPGVDPWGPPAGRPLTLPTAHIPPAGSATGIVINVGDMRLYWFGAEGDADETFPIGIGDSGRGLADARTVVAKKRVNPTWVVPPSIRAEEPDLPAVVPPGPDNPLGAFSLDLASDAYRIHGTNKPDGVGRRVSHGCFRLYPEDIARLFAEVPVGTRVTIVDQPAALAWIGGELYLQVHPSGQQADQLEATHALTPEPVPGLEDLVRWAAGDQVGRIMWITVEQVAAARRGVPQRITRPDALPPLVQ